jgi:hypothetical protein
MKLNGDDGTTILSSQQYVTKKERRRIIARWGDKDDCCIHVLPFVVGLDTAVKVVAEVEKEKKPSKKIDGTLQAKYFSNIHHLPNRINPKDYK